MSPSDTPTAELPLDMPAKETSVHSLSLDAIADWFVHRRRVLGIIYLGLMGLWIGLFLYSTAALVLPDVVNGAFWEGDPYLKFEYDRDAWGGKLLTIGAFCGLQALFLFGGGKIAIRPGKVRWHRRVVSLGIFASLMFMLTFGLGLAFLQMTARMRDGTRESDEVVNQFFERFGSSSLYVWLASLAVWSVWLLIGIISVRKVDQPTGLSRLVQQLLVGSWVEFAIALPIELVTRPRTKDCPCLSGSWLALMICLPLLVWSIGPALALLFWREKKLQDTDSKHGRRVLLSKSARGEAGGAKV